MDLEKKSPLDNIVDGWTAIINKLDPITEKIRKTDRKLNDTGIREKFSKCIIENSEKSVYLSWKKVDQSDLWKVFITIKEENVDKPFIESKSIHRLEYHHYLDSFLEDFLKHLEKKYK